MDDIGKITAELDQLAEEIASINRRPLGQEHDTDIGSIPDNEAENCERPD